VRFGLPETKQVGRGAAFLRQPVELRDGIRHHGLEHGLGHAEPVLHGVDASHRAVGGREGNLEAAFGILGAQHRHPEAREGDCGKACHGAGEDHPDAAAAAFGDGFASADLVEADSEQAGDELQLG
jgi:hypothetical protein